MKKVLKYFVLVLLVAYLACSIVIAKMQAESAVCKKVEVRILNAGNTVFLTKEGILKELKDLKIYPVGKPIKDINTDKIERTLDKYDYLEGAECMIVNNEKLVIEVKQILPVMRVFDGSKSYYLNKDGKRMRADARYHIDVPVVKGNFNNRFTAKSLLPLVEYIASDSALNTFVTMVEARDSNNIFIVPIIHGHIVNLGQPKDFESKFRKLKLMYKEVMPVKGWYTYDTISVKWDYQIVATKRKKKIEEQVVFDPNDDEPEPDLETISLPEKNEITNAPVPEKKKPVRNPESKKGKSADKVVKNAFTSEKNKKRQ